ncbi:hypothetical protein BDF19DRAFT_419812 [Syncephalis fuscata]|nr:hypothetical protein BDF19DRAFT_419812 [Syncephalis fuscata]
MLLEKHRKSLSNWLAGLNRKVFSELLHFNLILASVASTLLANRPWLMALANIIDYFVFGVRPRRQWKRLKQQQKQQRLQKQQEKQQEPYTQRRNSYSWFRKLISHAIRNVMNFTDESALASSTFDVEHMPLDENYDSSIAGALKSALGFDSSRDEMNNDVHINSTINSGSNSHNSHNRHSGLAEQLSDTERIHLYREQEVSRWRLACALVIVWIRVIAGGEKSTLVHYYFYFINIPISFANRPIAGLLLAAILLFSHLFMRNVTLVDMWLVSTSAALHLLVMYSYRRLNQRLATACKQRNELIESLSHEIRTPLHGVLGALEILREMNHTNNPNQLPAVQKRPEMANWHHTLKESAQALSETLENVMSYSNIQRGPLRPIYAELPLKALINAMDALIADSHSRDKVPVHRCITRSIRVDRLVLRTDGAMLTKVLTAGLSNALKFTAHVNGSVWICISRVPRRRYSKSLQQIISSRKNEQPNEEEIDQQEQLLPEQHTAHRLSKNGSNQSTTTTTTTTTDERQHTSWDKIATMLHIKSNDHIRRSSNLTFDEPILPKRTKSLFNTINSEVINDDIIDDSHQDGVIISIRDSGCGMETDFIRQAAWRPFATSSRATERPYRGTGLGLYIAKTYADQLGARLRVCSRKGYGTLFQVVLPASMFVTTLGSRSASSASLGNHRTETMISRSNSLRDRSRQTPPIQSASTNQPDGPLLHIPSTAQSVPVTTDVMLTNDTESLNMDNTNIHTTSCEHDYFCRHRLRSHGQPTGIYTESCATTSAWSPALPVHHLLTADKSMNESTINQPVNGKVNKQDIVVEEDSAYFNQPMVQDEGLMQQFRYYPHLRDYTESHRRTLSSDSHIHSNHSRKSSISTYTDDSQLTPEVDEDGQRLSGTTASNPLTPTAGLYPISGLSYSNGSHSIRRRDSRGPRRQGSTSRRSKRHRRHRSLHAISSNWLTVSDNEDEMMPSYSACHKNWLPFSMNSAPLLTPDEHTRVSTIANNTNNGAISSSALSHIPNGFDTKLSNELDIADIDNDVLAPIHELCTSIARNTSRKEVKDTDQNNNDQSADEVVVVSKKAMGMSINTTTGSSSTATTTATTTTPVTTTPTPTTATTSATTIATAASTAMKSPSYFTNVSTNSNSVHPMSLMSHTPWTPAFMGSSATSICPTPPTTEEPIVSCTDWCPYFEGPSSLYALSGPPSTSSLMRTTHRGTNTSTVNDSFSTSIVSPKTPPAPPSATTIANGVVTANDTPSTASTLSIPANTNNDDNDHHDNATDTAFIKDHPMPRLASYFNQQPPHPLHRIPSLGVPPKPRRDRNNMNINNTGTDSDSVASPLPPANPLALCCDDNPINLRLLLRRMESVGFECLAATSGEEAVARAEQLLKSNPPQCLALIMMDFHLPGIDGIETISQLRSLNWPRDPLCVLNTADTSEDLKARASSAGIWEYLTKPFPVDVLRGYRDRVVLLKDSQGEEEEEEEEEDTEDTEEHSIIKGHSVITTMTSLISVEDVSS